MVEHLVELRRRLGTCLLAVALTSCAGFWLADDLIGWLKQPAGDALLKLAVLSPTEALLAHVKVAVTFGIVLALPVILLQVWAFVRPALSWKERSYGLAFVWWGSLLFILGAEVAYGIVLPVFLKFLLSIGRQHLEPVISVSRYLSFALGIIVWCGVLCELPLLTFLLSRLGLVTPQALRRRRSVALLGILGAAAVLTPTTDAISLLLTSIPLWLLYELSILISASSRPPARPPSSRPDRLNV